MLICNRYLNYACIASAGLAASVALLSCSSPVEVQSAEVAAVVVSPESMTLQVGRSERFLVTLLDAEGSPTRGRQVFWAVEDTNIARVTVDGVVEARKIGTTKVAASADGHSDIAALTVIQRRVSRVSVSPSTAQVQAGSTVQLQATAFDDWNDAITGRSFAWQSSDASRATVSSSGVVSGVAPGTVTISASTDGQSSSATVTITAAPVASITVSPSNTTLFPGQTQQLTATLYDSQGQPITGHTVTWSTNRPAVATVDQNGLVRAVGLGVATVTATAGGRSGSATVRVQLIPVSSVVIKPSNAEMDTRSQLKLEATVYGEDGSVLTDRTVTWESSNTRVATVDDTGLVTSTRREGTTTITATVEDVSGTARIEVDD